MVVVHKGNYMAVVYSLVSNQGGTDEIKAGSNSVSITYLINFTKKPLPYIQHLHTMPASRNFTANAQLDTLTIYIDNTTSTTGISWFTFGI